MEDSRKLFNWANYCQYQFLGFFETQLSERQIRNNFDAEIFGIISLNLIMFSVKFWKLRMEFGHHMITDNNFKSSISSSQIDFFNYQKRNYFFIIPHRGGASISFYIKLGHANLGNRKFMSSLRNGAKRFLIIYIF